MSGLEEVITTSQSCSTNGTYLTNQNTIIFVSENSILIATGSVKNGDRNEDVESRGESSFEPGRFELELVKFSYNLDSNFTEPDFLGSSLARMFVRLDWQRDG